jgi:hypothetical protein
MAENKVEKIGVIFVHGIGEQRRFEHLEAQLRPLIDAIRRRSGDLNVTIEIVGASASVLHADQDTWASGAAAPVRAIVRDSTGEKHLHFHEVWWADVNEPYTFAKEWRFWAWGLAVWNLPNKLRSTLKGASTMRRPRFPHGLTKRDEFVARLKLFFVSNVFLMGAFTVGLAVYLARRLLGYSAPNVVRVFVNYLSAVKLYSQTERSDGGFLDAYRAPPRVSIRRRMIRAMLDVAAAGYDRWYVFAHSLGSVVAFNGLMENSHCLPNYLDEERYRQFYGSLVGPAQSQHFVGDTADMMPPRPLWLADDDVVYREKVLEKFRGLLTYGSPLDKFATIWPARVPINVREPFFHTDAEWINIYDPTDPVGASLDAFGGPGAPFTESVLQPKNYGYRAHWLLLYSHLCYLRVHEGRKCELSDAAVEWVLSGRKFSAHASPHENRWFIPASRVEIRRTLWARTMWVVTYVALTLAAALVLPWAHSSFPIRALALVFVVMVITFLAGLIARRWIFERDRDDVERRTGKEPKRPEGYRLD